MEMRFWYCTDSFRVMWNKYGVYFSEKFCHYFSQKIQEILYQEAGLKPSYKVGLSVFRPHHDLPMYEPGPVSKINTAISILPMFNDSISFCWRSKSGKIVHSYDEDFDEDDLECWIEGLKPALYLEALTTVNIDHPLKLKDLPYELTVYGIGMHMGLTIELEDPGKAAEIIEQLGDEVERHNQKSEAKGRANGVVHNCSGHIENNTVIFRIDVGSAGVVFIKKLLRLLAKYPEVKKVTADL
jgi:hypothetical protein